MCLGNMFRFFSFCKYVEWFLECHQADVMLSNSNTNYCVVKFDVKYNSIIYGVTFSNFSVHSFTFSLKLKLDKSSLYGVTLVYFERGPVVRACRW